ncbi:MAG: hypothetical protein JO297_15990 [Nitrososphaeraceae archaeon]|nr:hypothetical protein [Nitrososphaeraceae archaeon]
MNCSIRDANPIDRFQNNPMPIIEEYRKSSQTIVPCKRISYGNQGIPVPLGLAAMVAFFFIILG